MQQPAIDPPREMTWEELYDAGLPVVYGYLLRRCGDRFVAEDLTGDTFLAAARSARTASVEPTVAWLMTIARNKLVDHWRRQVRAERLSHLADDGAADTSVHVAERASEPVHAVLAQLSPTYRAALTFRYVDGMSVPEVAELLGRPVPATQALIVRARARFRLLYETREAHHG